MKFDAYIYRTLFKCGNVALPYSANKCTAKELKDHFKEVLGGNYTVRKAEFTIFGLETKSKKYWIVEEKNELRRHAF